MGMHFGLDAFSIMLLMMIAGLSAFTYLVLRPEKSARAPAAVVPLPAAPLLRFNEAEIVASTARMAELLGELRRVKAEPVVFAEPAYEVAMAA